MLQRATLWILTAAITASAGAIVPVCRPVIVKLEVRVAWQDERPSVRPEFRLSSWSRRPEGKSFQASAAPDAARRIQIHDLYNRPPPFLAES
jgi:hypothetical protein